MKIRVTGTSEEILHYTKKLKEGTDYEFVREPTETKMVEGGTDKGKFRKHFTVREVFRPTQKKKSKRTH